MQVVVLCSYLPLG